jgi:hypothetical protein
MSIFKEEYEAHLKTQEALASALAEVERLTNRTHELRLIISAKPNSMLQARDNLFVEAMAELKAAIDIEDYSPQMIALRTREVVNGLIYELDQLP